MKVRAAEPQSKGRGGRHSAPATPKRKGKHQEKPRTLSSDVRPLVRYGRPPEDLEGERAWMDFGVAPHHATEIEPKEPSGEARGITYGWRRSGSGHDMVVYCVMSNENKIS